ncbi:hypothetical protein, partial [Parvimonas micra]|uniref:hypothetical protein n=1 Tax=Parvimonas micra TaxID=33033 RepID=UPI002B46F90A
FSRKRYYLSTGLAKHTLQDRIEYHKAAINSLTQMAAAQPAKRAMIEQVMAKLDERFVRIIHEYESRMNAVIDAANV